MKIYTKKGDAGETGLYGNVRVPKDDLRIASYGTLDELNSILGLVLGDIEIHGQLKTHLSRVQNELFQLGTELACPPGKDPGIELMNLHQIHQLEREIDAMETELAPLKAFILPGGVRAAALLHFARTVCRRAEREIVALHRSQPLRADVLQYVNRLSDYLFVCARFVNLKSKAEDIPWVAPRKGE